MTEDFAQPDPAMAEDPEQKSRHQSGFDVLGDGLGSLLSDVGDSIVDATTGVINALPALSDVAGGAGEMLESMASSAGEVFGGLGAGAGEALGAVASGAGEALGAVASGAGEVLGAVASGAGEVLGGLLGELFS